MDFSLRVRRRTYVWGGGGVHDNLPPAPPLFLTFRSERFGDKLHYVQQRMDNGVLKTMTSGDLEPGEGLTVVLNGSCGIYVELPQGGVSTALTCQIQAGVV